MAKQLNDLFEHEFENLLEALRRDYRHQALMAVVTCGTTEEFEYQVNARKSKHLLHHLNPKAVPKIGSLS